MSELAAYAPQDAAPRRRPPGFRAYAAGLRPALEAAVVARLSQLLAGLGSLESGGSLSGLAAGKKVRGSLSCLVAAALGAGLDRALPRATAIELIQAATLVHDDFVDQHQVRRASPALWTLVGARRAVLVGDVLFASAIAMTSELSPADGGITAHAIAEIATGALQEPLDAASLADGIEAGHLDGALYEQTIHLKTGVLFGAACQLGAVAAGASRASRQAWRDYGLRVGEAYQIADDLHDVRRCLAAPACDPSTLVSVAPAVLSFAPDARSTLVRLARSFGSTAADELRQHLTAAATAMSAELHYRVAAAADLAERLAPSGEYRRLTREAPQELIEMLDESDATPSAP